MDTVKIFGYNLVRKELSIIPTDKKVLVNTISPNSYGISLKDNLMHEALTHSDYLVLDGLYFGLAPLLLKGIRVKRYAGWDCFRHFSRIANEKGGKVFFLGSSPDTLNKIETRFHREFTNTRTATCSPPFKAEFSGEDLVRMRKAVNDFRPDILFVGLTAPKQEKWGYQNIQFLDVHVICTIGNVFDWYAGNAKRPGKFWQKIGLEWFIRIFYRPEVLKRNISNQITFFWHLFLMIIKVKKYD